MATLDGSARQVNLGQGISVRAPGLRGSAEAHNVAPGSTTRAPEVDGSGPALDAALAREGLSQSEIAGELEINKSNVSRHMRKARELGDIPMEAKK